MASRVDSIYGDLPDSWLLTSVATLVELGEAEIQTGPFGTMLHASAYRSTGTPVIAVKNIADNRLTHDDIPRVDDDTCNRLARYRLQCGDILFGRKGAVERRTLIRDREHGWIQGSDCIRLRILSPKIDSTFVSYVLGTPQYRSWIMQNAQGATMPSLNQEIIGRIPLPLPSFNEQRAIAHILGTLDDKIELNRRMNETLEAMARAIFQSWFVDFDPVCAKVEGREPGLPKEIAALFPDSFEESELGEVPRGWSVRTLWNCADYINGSAFRNDAFSPDRLGLPVIKIGELKDGISAQTKFTEAMLEPKYRINSGDILFSWSGSPDTSIDTFVWAGGEGWLNQHIFKIQFKCSEEKFFVYELLRHLNPVFVEIARNKQTTGLGHVTAQDLKRLKTVFPPALELRAFNQLAEPLFNRAFANRLESRTLTVLRDTLLPKFISGELRVKDAERIAEAAL